MRASDFDYDLPPGLIAQIPAARREDARLLVLDRSGAGVRHARAADMGSFLRSGDLLVVNDTRVLPARVFARRETGGQVELLFVAPASGDPLLWEAVVRAGGALREGESLRAGAETVQLVERRGAGAWTVRVPGDVVAFLERLGKMPLPPYIRRERDDAHDALDRERYQTVFAKTPGAIAAPTAGLHLTDDLLEDLAAADVGVASVTLHVGLGTFLPIRTDDLDEHEMHAERFDVPTDTVDAIRATRARGGRIVAVGTTTVRALEASAAGSEDRLPAAGAARTSLFIRPGHDFRVVDGLLTNFHLPRSTLLALVSAFAGRDRVLAAYAEAVRLQYRFYSYGDAMLIV